jgi:hypothetical protein
MHKNIAGIGLLFILVSCTGTATQQPVTPESAVATPKPSLTLLPTETREFSTKTPEISAKPVYPEITLTSAGNNPQSGVEILQFDDVQPSPEDSSLKKGKVFIEKASFQQGILSIAGSLPTPCHKLRIIFLDPTFEKNIINVTAYSLRDGSLMCIQSLAPFQVDIPLGNLHDGFYTVILNNDGLLKFDWPEKT